MIVVEDFIFQHEGNQRELMLFFHHYLSNDCNLNAKMRFKIPFYDAKSWVCYLNPIKKDRVELAFIRGNELSNVHGLLQSKGRKQVSGIELELVTELPLQQISEILHEAILLDRKSPYSVRKKTDCSFNF